MAWELELTESILEDLYVWIDNIPLSKPKKKIERDFSDGILSAEIIRHYLPDMINLNNYIASSSVSQKKINWGMLNKKVLTRIGLNLPENIIKDLSNGKPGTIELFLFNMRLKIDEELELRQKMQSQGPGGGSPHQSSISLNNLPRSINDSNLLLTKRQSIINPKDKWISRLDYEDLKQECLQFQEEIEILQAKMRRLEHVIQLKELRINELSTIIEEYRRTKPTSIITNKIKKK